MIWSHFFNFTASLYFLSSFNQVWVCLKAVLNLNWYTVFPFHSCTFFRWQITVAFAIIFYWKKKNEKFTSLLIRNSLLQTVGWNGFSEPLFIYCILDDLGFIVNYLNNSSQVGGFTLGLGIDEKCTVFEILNINQIKYTKNIYTAIWALFCKYIIVKNNSQYKV